MALFVFKVFVLLAVAAANVLIYVFVAGCVSALECLYWNKRFPTTFKRKPQLTAFSLLWPIGLPFGLLIIVVEFLFSLKSKLLAYPFGAGQQFILRQAETESEAITEESKQAPLPEARVNLKVSRH